MSPTDAADPLGAGAARVLFVGAEALGWRAGGMNRYAAELRSRLLAAGTMADAVVIDGEDSIETAEAETVAICGRHSVARRVVRVARAARRLLEDADAIDSHFALYGLLPILLARRRGTRVVVHFHGPWSDESAASGGARAFIWLKYRWERAAYRRADIIVCLSEAFAALLEQRFGIDRSRISVIPPGVNTDRFRPRDRDAARARLGVDPDARVMVTVRRLVPRTGVHDLITAHASMTTQNRMLLVVGDGPEQASLRRLADGLGVGASTRFLGEVDDDLLVDAYCAADVSVVPSRSLEGYGLVVLESLATGTPVVGTEVGGLADVVRSIEPRNVVAPGDHRALARRLDDVLARPWQAADIARCRQWAVARQWQSAVSAHTGVYVATRRTRVVFVDHASVRSGAELSLARMIPFLDIDSHVIFGAEGEVADRVRATGTPTEVLALPAALVDLHRSGLRVLQLPALMAGWIRAVVGLRRRLRGIRPDVVHPNSLMAGLYAIPAARSLGVATVWHVHDRVSIDYFGAFQARVLGWALRRWPDTIVVNSRATRDTLATDRPVYVVPPPVEPALRSLGERRYEGPPTTISMIGRITPWKGQDVFLEGFARAFPADGDLAGVRAVVAGAALFGPEDEAFLDRLRAQASGPELEGRVRFAGHVDDLESLYRDADVVVHASVLPEPFGAVIGEAMTAGVPIVAARAGGPVETIVDGRTGLLYEPGDPEALARSLRRLIDPTERQRLAEAARRTAEAFRPETLARRYLEIYDQVGR